MLFCFHCDADLIIYQSVWSTFNTKQNEKKAKNKWKPNSCSQIIRNTQNDMQFYDLRCETHPCKCVLSFRYMSRRLSPEFVVFSDELEMPEPRRSSSRSILVVWLAWIFWNSCLYPWNDGAFIKLISIWVNNAGSHQNPTHTYIQYFSMSLKGVNHVRVSRQWYFCHLLIYIGQLKMENQSAAVRNWWACAR